MRFLYELNNECVPLFEKWEALKEKKKISAIERSSSIAFEARKQEKHLLDNLHRLCDLECENPGAGAEHIDVIKSSLNALSEEKYRGVVIQARAEKFLCGEQPTKRALGAGKSKAMKKERNSPRREPIFTYDKDVIEDTFV